MELEVILKNKSIKLTKTRICILSIISSCEKAISADFIFAECKNKGIDIDLSTVYRNLDIFNEKDILEKFDLGNGKYNYKIKEDCHKDILECIQCHKIIEIDCPMSQVEEVIKNKTGYTLVEHEFKAICKECMLKNKKINHF